MAKKKSIGIIILAVMLLGGAVAAVPLWRIWQDYRGHCLSSRVEMYVYPETSSAEVLSYICDSLDAASDRSMLERSFEREDLASRIHAGHYAFEKGASAMSVARALKFGWQTPVNLVISPSIRSREKFVEKVSSQLLLSSQELADSIASASFLEPYGVTPEEFFGAVSFNTYNIKWTASAKDVMDAQKKDLDAFWTKDNLDAAAKQGLGRKEVTVLASIVNCESNYAPEYPDLAAVYLNRLHKGWKLEACPTVAFLYGFKLTRILEKHIKTPSPYNTYLNEGLPPAPICVPTKDALKAVIHPSKHEYMFFCASDKMDGTHKFAKTLAEHNRNGEAYRKACYK